MRTRSERRAPPRSASWSAGCRSRPAHSRRRGYDQSLRRSPQGGLPSSVLRLMTVRGWSPLWSVGALRVDDPGEEAVAGAGSTPGWTRSRGARVVVRVVEADRIRVAGCLRRSRRRAARFIAVDECRHRSRNPDGQGLGGVARARQQQAASSRSPTLIRSPGRRPSSISAEALGWYEGRHPHVVRLQLVERQVGRHQLRGAGDRQALVLPPLPAMYRPRPLRRSGPRPWHRSWAGAAAAAEPGSPTRMVVERDRDRDAHAPTAPPGARHRHCQRNAIR